MFQSLAPSDVYSAITPSNSVNFPVPTRGIYVGVAGDVVCVPATRTGEGPAVLFKAVPAGTVLPIAALRVNLTSTTATDMVALF
jgi:hypothetical protein